MAWGMRGVILSLHSFSCSFFFLSLPWFIYSLGFRARGGGWVNARAHKVCMKEFVCVCHCVYERDTSNWIDKHTGHSLQGPVTIMASNPGVLWYTHTHTHIESVTGSISCSQETFWWCCRSRCCSSCCCFVLLFWVRSVSENNWGNLHKISMIDHCILPS